MAQSAVSTASVASSGAKSAAKSAASDSAKPARKAAAGSAAQPVAKRAGASAKSAKSVKPAKEPKTSKAVAKPKPKAEAAPVARHAPAPKAADAKQKLVRDSFTMPRADFDLIDKLKSRALSFHRPVKKSELLRAGLHALAAQSDGDLAKSLSGLTALKAGRPKKQA